MAGAKRRAVSSASNTKKRQKRTSASSGGDIKIRQRRTPEMSGVTPGQGPGKIYGATPRAPRATKARSANRSARFEREQARARGLALSQSRAQPKPPSLGDKISGAVTGFASEVRNYSGPHTPLGRAALAAIQGKKDWDKVMGNKTRAN